jgi:hypothetical protein
MPLGFIESSIKMRIAQVLRHKETTVKDLVGKREINYRALADQLNGTNTKLGFCLIYLICDKYPDISTDWILTGKGEMLKDLTATTSVPALELRIAEQEYLIETQKKVIRLYEKLEKNVNQ